MKRWGVNSAKKPVSKVVIIGGLATSFVLFYIMYHLIVPFKPFNPLHQEATMGEPVIDHWDYKGMNEEGYLQFFNSDSGQTTELPPNEKMLALDGKFVMIEKAAPDAITYANPLDAIPNEWLFILLAPLVLLVSAGVIVFHARRRPASFVPRSKKTTHVSNTRSQNFKPHRSSKRG